MTLPYTHEEYLDILNTYYPHGTRVKCARHGDTHTVRNGEWQTPQSCFDSKKDHCSISGRALWLRWHGNWAVILNPDGTERTVPEKATSMFPIY